MQNIYVDIYKKRVANLVKLHKNKSALLFFLSISTIFYINICIFLLNSLQNHLLNTTHQKHSSSPNNTSFGNKRFHNPYKFLKFVSKTIFFLDIYGL